MLPSMGPESRKRVKTKPHLVILIKEGWCFDEKAGRFVSEKKQYVETKTDLPPRSHVEYLIPKPAKAAKRSLSKEESDLLRYFTLILPSGSDPSDYIKVVKKWPCVKDVQPPREVGLPDQL